MDDSFYKSKRWQAKRKHILVRDKYIDQYLLQAEGLHREAELVHHILPREEFPQYQWCDWNLISVSKKTHRRLHIPMHNTLSNEGKRLAKATAAANGIKINMRTLVIGLPGSGKTTYVKQHMDGALVYDLDYIAGAFRLAGPKVDNNLSARKMANALLEGFCEAVSNYNSNCYVIRVCPNQQEISAIDPDRIIVCDINNELSTDNEIAQRINALIEWAELNGINVERI